MFGPVMGFVCGGLGDLIQFVIKPTGAYFPGWTISAALAGFIYGLFFYGCNMKVAEKYDEQGQKKGILRIIDFKFLLRCAAALTIDTLLVNVLLGTYWWQYNVWKGLRILLINTFC